MSDVLVDLTPLDTWSRFSGTGRYVHELGKALAALDERERGGLELSALTSLDGDTGALDWHAHGEPRFDSAQEVEFLMQRRTRLVSTLRRLRPRMFHATYHLGTPRGSFVPRVVTCLDVIRLVRHQDYLAGRWAYRQLLRAAEALRFHSAARVITISKYTADDIIKLLGISASQIDVVLLGVDLDRYRLPDSDGDIDAVLERYGLTRGRYLFHVGAADPRKNVDILLAAYAQAKLDGVELAIIGKLRASDRRAFDAALDQAGHPEGVRFVGFVPEPDMPAVVAGGLALVFCSDYEGFGAPPIEAMACGCPVIHTGVTSMEETIGDIGLRVPPRDIPATAEAMRQVALNADLRASLRDEGLARAAQFSWRNTALGTVDAYQRALR